MARNETMSDEDFLSYVESHSRTERHAFHKDDVDRLEELAGVNGVSVTTCGLPNFFGVDEYEADRLVTLARKRIRSK